MDLYYVNISQYSQAILIEPPKNIKQSDYICSNKFFLDPIIEMYKIQDTCYVVAVNGKPAKIYR